MFQNLCFTGEAKDFIVLMPGQLHAQPGIFRISGRNPSQDFVLILCDFVLHVSEFVLRRGGQEFYRFDARLTSRSAWHFSNFWSKPTPGFCAYFVRFCAPCFGNCASPGRPGILSIWCKMQGQLHAQPGIFRISSPNQPYDLVLILCDFVLHVSEFVLHRGGQKQPLWHLDERVFPFTNCVGLYFGRFLKLLDKPTK